MKQNGQAPKHLMATELEIGDAEFRFNVTETDLLLDLKYLIKEYYCGTFTDDVKSLKLNFCNGQRFVLQLKEI